MIINKNGIVSLKRASNVAHPSPAIITFSEVSAVNFVNKLNKNILNTVSNIATIIVIIYMKYSDVSKIVIKIIKGIQLIIKDNAQNRPPKSHEYHSSFLKLNRQIE